MTRRKATVEDLPAISEILRLSPQAGQWLPDPDETWVVEDPQIVGFVALRSPLPDEAEILNLAVHPAHRRGGIGALLLSGLGYENLYLEVRETNETAIAFYNKLGFYKQGVRPGYYSQPTEDAVLLARKGLA